MNCFGLTQDDVDEDNRNDTTHNNASATASATASVTASAPATILFCEELIHIVERACPGVRQLLNQGHTHHGHAFPPVHCNTLLQMFMIGTEDVPAKTCLALYAALDVAAGTPLSVNIDLNTYVERVAADFA